MVDIARISNGKHSKDNLFVIFTYQLIEVNVIVEEVEYYYQV